MVEKALDQDEIEPAVELPPDLVEMRDFSEPETRVEVYRPVVCRVDSADHDMLPERHAALEQRRHQRRSDPAAARVGAHMHRMLDRVAIAGPAAAPVAERRESNDAALVCGDDRGKPGLPAPDKPGAPVF